MQMFRFVSQMGFIKLQQSHKLNKAQICALLSIYKYTNFPTKKQQNQTSQDNTHTCAYERIDTYTYMKYPVNLY